MPADIRRTPSFNRREVKLKFRKDINGLRAIAVLSVVLFHFEPELVKGGFVGVDIFFVISGFLMTSIVFTKLDKQQFGLISFYVSRANRIIPALLVVIAVLTIALPFVIPIPDYQEFAKRAVSALLFISNNYFYSLGGYFEADSQFNWLLHTWSLSVEWQFYIFFPLFAIALHKFTAQNKFFICFLLLLASFCVGVFYSYKDSSFGYFMLLTRAWELLAGSLVYFIGINKISKESKVLEYVGLVLVFVSILFVDESTPWPGYMALLPVIGTCLVLLSKQYTSRLTGNPIFQKVGLWSYSIYLWHWPLVVLGQFIDLPYWTVIGLVASLILGWASYSIVEIRNIFSYSIFRLPNKLTAPFAVVAFCSFIVIIFLASKQFSEVYPEKVTPYVMGLHYLDKGNQRYPEKGKIVHINKNAEKKPRYLMIGDSNAAHYAYGMSTVDDRHFLLSWVSSCLNFPDYTTKPYAVWMDEKWEKQCKNNYKKIYDYEDIDVILAQHWHQKSGLVCISNECSFDLTNVSYMTVLKHQIEKLIALVGDRKLYIVGFVPAPTHSVVSCMRKIVNTDCERVSSEFSPERLEINNLINQLSSNYSNVYFINPFDAVCNKQNLCNTVIDDKNIFFDEGHLSQYGSRVMWEYISTKLP